MDDPEVATEGDDEEEGEDREEDGTSATDVPPPAGSGKRRKRVSAKFGKGKKGKKRGKLSAAASPATPLPDNVDPATASSAELCDAYGLDDVDFQYRDEELQNCHSSKGFAIRFKSQLVAANPKASSTKISTVMAAKFREFQEQQMLLNIEPAIKSGAASKKLREKTVAPLKIRISARAKKRKRDDGTAESSDEEGHVNSDAEFEALLREHEKQEDEAAAEKARKKAEKMKAKQAKNRPKAKRRKVDGTEEGYDSEHQEYCEVCQQAGEIILCDTCPRAYHLVCLDPDMEEPPEGKWSCPHCESEGVEPKSTQGDAAEGNKKEKGKEGGGNFEFCRICRDGGFVLCCDNCPDSYHMWCLHPPIKEVPEGEWFCPRCACPEPPHRLEKCLSWRWIEIESHIPETIDVPPPVEPPPAAEKPPEEVSATAPAAAESQSTGTESGESTSGEKPVENGLGAENPEPPTADKKEGGEQAEQPKPPASVKARIVKRREREFFVKWKYRSFWHCEWVNELVLDVWFTQSMRMYWRKMDPEVPPEGIIYKLRDTCL